MSHAESDDLLRKAYGAAIREAGAAKVESVAFPLISAKIFRGNRDLAGLLELSLDALVTAADASSLKEVVLVQVMFVMQLQFILELVEVEVVVVLLKLDLMLLQTLEVMVVMDMQVLISNIQ